MTSKSQGFTVAFQERNIKDSFNEGIAEWRRSCEVVFIPRDFTAFITDTVNHAAIFPKNSFDVHV